MRNLDYEFVIKLQQTGVGSKQKITMSRFILSVKQKIAKGDLEQAIGELQKIAHKTSLLNDVILHSSRLNVLSKEIHKGVIKHDDADITRNKITDAVLSLIDEIDYEIGNNVEIKNEVDKFFITHQRLKEDESAMTLDERKERFRHFDNYDNFINSKLPEERFHLQKLNSEIYLRNFGLTVENLKENLTALDYFNGEINNGFSRELANSLEMFQIDNNMRHIDGFFGELTFDMIALRLKEKI